MATSHTEGRAVCRRVWGRQRRPYQYFLSTSCHLGVWVSAGFCKVTLHCKFCFYCKGGGWVIWVFSCTQASGGQTVSLKYLESVVRYVCPIGLLLLKGPSMCINIDRHMFVQYIRHIAVVTNIKLCGNKPNTPDMTEFLKFSMRKEVKYPK